VKERRAARRLALDVLYQSEIRDQLPQEAWSTKDRVTRAPDEDFEAEDGRGRPSNEAIGYAHGLVEGVQAHQAEIDGLIVRYADRWAIRRMPVIDRTLVRMALYELLWRRDVPVPVAINEAVELAKELSTEDSGRFVNGLLGRIVERERAD
jgi:transcription antitermination protein NusB